MIDIKKNDRIYCVLNAGTEKRFGLKTESRPKDRDSLTKPKPMKTNSYTNNAMF